MRTGVTMTLTSISAMTAMFLISSLFGIPLLPDIAIVLVFGLTVDLMNTYMMNLSLLRWYKFEGVAQ
jgi:preprotein translocase subunit SecF